VRIACVPRRVSLSRQEYPLELTILSPAGYASVAHAQQNDPAPGSVYVVQPGDTLFSIAQRAYGDPGRWNDIYQALQFAFARSGLFRHFFRHAAHMRLARGGRQFDAQRLSFQARNVRLNLCDVVLLFFR
jgi:hypothetical protein